MKGMKYISKATYIFNHMTYLAKVHPKNVHVVNSRDMRGQSLDDENI